MAPADPDGLTPKGRATRTRIVEMAGELMYEHGVRNTSNEMVRRAAGVSGSQMSHYFADKRQLIRAVVARQSDTMRGRLTTPPRGPLDSIEALQRGAGAYVADPSVVAGGCSFGSLCSEILKSEPELIGDIADGFELWAGDFRTGLATMKANGTLRPDADIEALVHTLAAAFQGGALLTQATGDAAPLRDALESAIAVVRAASISPRERHPVDVARPGSPRTDSQTTGG